MCTMYSTSYEYNGKDNDNCTDFSAIAMNTVRSKAFIQYTADSKDWKINIE